MHRPLNVSAVCGAYQPLYYIAANVSLHKIENSGLGYASASLLVSLAGRYKHSAK